MNFNDGKMAVMIPTYKLRRRQMIDYVEQFTDRYDVYIVSLENDPAKNAVYDIVSKTKMNFLSPDVTSIFAKREWMLEFAKSKQYKYLCQIDDDILTNASYIVEGDRTEGGSYKYHQDGQLCDMIDEMYAVIKEHRCGMIGSCIFGHQGTTNNFVNQPYVKRAFITNVVILDVEKAYNSDIHYDTSGEICEDTDICIKYLQEGYYTYKMKKWAWLLFDKETDAKQSAIYDSIDDLHRLIFNTCLKYNIPLGLSKDGTTITNGKANASLYFGTTKLPDIDKNLLKYYKAKDMKGLILYLKINKQNTIISGIKKHINRYGKKGR